MTESKIRHCERPQGARQSQPPATMMINFYREIATAAYGDLAMTRRLSNE
jgi:hypothetical protein